MDQGSVSQQNSGCPGRFKVQVPMVQTVQKMVDVHKLRLKSNCGSSSAKTRKGTYDSKGSENGGGSSN